MAMSRRAFARRRRQKLIIGVGAFLALGIILVVAYCCLSGSKTEPIAATLAGQKVKWKKSADKAEAMATLSGDQALHFDENSIFIKVQLTGQDSGFNVSASNESSFLDKLSGKVKESEEDDFTFNANYFEVGEVVIGEVTFDEAPNNVFEDSASVRYFSFTVGEAPEPEPTTDAGSADSATSNSSESATVANSVAATVYFNGFTVNTYESKEDALANAMGVGADLLNCSIKATVGDGVKRVRVWTENEYGTSNGDEFFLWSENGWSATMDLSNYGGNTIIVAVSVADNAVPPHNTYRYFALALPAK